MNTDNILKIASKIQLAKSMRIDAKKGLTGPSASFGYNPSRIDICSILAGQKYSGEFIHAHAPIFERHGAQMKAELEIAMSMVIAQLEAELKGEICPQPEPRRDAYLDPVYEAFGDHQGLNADWNTMAWRVSGDVWLLDDEDNGLVSLVAQSANPDISPCTTIMCNRVEVVLPVALAIKRGA